MVAFCVRFGFMAFFFSLLNFFIRSNGRAVTIANLNVGRKAREKGKRIENDFGLAHSQNSNDFNWHSNDETSFNSIFFISVSSVSFHFFLLYSSLIFFCIWKENNENKWANKLSTICLNSKSLKRLFSFASLFVVVFFVLFCSRKKKHKIFFDGKKARETRILWNWYIHVVSVCLMKIYFVCANGWRFYREMMIKMCRSKLFSFIHSHLRDFKMISCVRDHQPHKRIKGKKKN